MHDAVRRWVADWATGIYESVLEVGSRDVNGGVRDLIRTEDYLGLDLLPGPGVDLVGDARGMVGEFDLVLCLEALEHDYDPASLISALGRLCKPGGRVIATAGGPGRTPHSAFDGGPLQDGEHYGNLDEAHFCVAWGSVVSCQIADYDWRVVWDKFPRT